MESQKIKAIFTKLDATDKVAQKALLDEFRLQNSGFYTKKALFEFLEKNLATEHGEDDCSNA